MLRKIRMAILTSTDPNRMQSRLVRISSIMITISLTTETLILKDTTREIIRGIRERDLSPDMLKSLGGLIKDHSNNLINKEKIDKIFKNPL